ncbi:MAG: hypothetical protein NT135_00900 [Candidatus Berkelbacteria bacterium]|nr:hypothetical protein [Candidatus Berkelbacteria bacterium]
MTKKVFSILFYLLLCLNFNIFLFHGVALALTKAEAETMNVSASVPSPVSPENSSVKFNTQETLADPVNHPILMTVYLLDSNKKPLAEREVAVTSNRGNVDVIEAISKLSQYKTQAAEVSAMQKDKTDKEGKVSFKITSFVPGKATFQVLADNVVKLTDETVQFKSLPFPTDLTIAVDLLWTQKEWMILSPNLKEENLSSLQKEARAIANTGVKIKIPFWLFFLAAVLILGSPFFIMLDFINLRKIRKANKQEIDLLFKIAASQDINTLKKTVREANFDHKEIIK